jgi:outer membrane protein assembly factor BamA
VGGPQLSRRRFAADRRGNDSTTTCRSTSATRSTSKRLREASRALFQTGFFQDFEFRKDGDTLVIVVLERPTIAEFKFSGNKDIKDDDLKKSLTMIGLAQGKTFDRSVLEEVTRELTEEYYGRGKYGAKITPTVDDSRRQQSADHDQDRGRRRREDSRGEHRRQHFVHR